MQSVESCDVAGAPGESCTGDVLAQLNRANFECALLEQALEEFPSTMEQKFRLRLNHVIEMNLHLKVQNYELRQALQSRGLVSTQKLGANVGLLLRCRPLLIGISLSGLTALLFWAVPNLGLRETHSSSGVRRSTLVAPVAFESNAILKLSADGASWVEVQDLATEKTLFVGILHAGEQRSIRMRRGLRLRSGRPDLLRLQIDDGSFVPFGTSLKLGWRVLLPPLKKQQA